MLITWENYRSHLPEAMHDRFRELANNNRYNRAIIYAEGSVRYATIDEY